MVVHEHDGPFFTGTLLKLNAIRNPSSEFNIFQVQLNKHNITTIHGDKLFEHRGDMKVHGNVMVNSSNRGDLFAVNNVHETQSLFTVNSEHGVMIGSNLSVANDSLRVSSNGLEAKSINITSSLRVARIAHIGEGLTIGNHFSYSSNGMKLSASRSQSSALLELRSDSYANIDAIIDIHAESTSGYILKASNQGLVMPTSR